jgi:hypothetical protein
MRCSAITAKGNQCKNSSNCWIHRSKEQVINKQESYNSTCSVCMETMGSNLLTLEKCKHNFCHDCITEWLCINNTCPLCREPVSVLEKSAANDFALKKGVITKVVITRFDRSILCSTDQAIFHFFYLLAMRETGLIGLANNNFIPSEYFSIIITEMLRSSGSVKRMLQGVLSTHSEEVKYFKTSTFAEINSGKVPERACHMILNDFDEIGI